MSRAIVGAVVLALSLLIATDVLYLHSRVADLEQVRAKQETFPPHMSTVETVWTLPSVCHVDTTNYLTSGTSTTLLRSGSVCAPVLHELCLFANDVQAGKLAWVPCLRAAP